MRILALETANSQCSVALYADDQPIFFAQNNDMRAQTQHILPMIAQAMAETATTWADIQVIGFSRGPGAFSGVRINAAVAQALAWTHDIPVVAVSSLQALAQQALRVHDMSRAVAVLDARMNEVYIARFWRDSNDIMQPEGEEQLLDYAQAQLLIGDISKVVGSGAGLIGANANALTADAHDIAQLTAHGFRLGQAVVAADALPIYLRDNAWKTIAEQQA